MGFSEMGLAGKVALVCGGGGGGSGSATSRILARAGATVFVVDYSDALVSEIVQDLEAAGARVSGLAADLRDPEQAGKVVGAAVSAFGRLDLVANIAGGTQLGDWARFEDTSNEAWRRIMALNLDYVFQVCRDAGRVMADQGQGGAIVNVASISGLRAAPFHAAYGAAKAALFALTQSMAVEWGQHRIRANVVTPGAVASARAGDRVEKFKKTATLGRASNPQDIANAICFLLSDAASAITGAQLLVDTGLAAKSVLGEVDEMVKTLDWQAQALAQAAVQK